MKTFDYQDAPTRLLTPDIVRLLTTIHELKGRQEVLLSQNPMMLDSLMDIAKIQSTGASNRIEGIATTDKRLRELVAEKSAPRNRDEREIAGYREVLSLIHENHEHIEPTANIILQLHRTLYSFSGDSAGGAWKNSDNAIAEAGADGKARIRFQPVSAWQTPETMERLCAAFAKAWRQASCDRLILSALFIFDFLCVHPFNDGNGRMSRLLTLLLFYRAGHTTGRYISIEKIIEGSKATYYEVLRESSQGWHENDNDYAPFVRYLLGVLLKACRELDTRSRLLTDGGKSKPEQIAEWIAGQIRPFGKRDILEALPDISQITVERTLAALLKTGVIHKRGGGPATTYTKEKWKI
ncbi:MAG TPA: cell filamentation protein Fic [Desulfobulbaceae bacterium]|nr:cell filamentation protein Fic [Desulfobulbaceae bacterium]